MKMTVLILTFFVSTGCVSFSRHADLVADTQVGTLRGTCADTRYQNSVEILKTGIQIRSQRYLEFGAFGFIIPFEFTKADSVSFDLLKLNTISDINAYAKKIRLKVENRELEPTNTEIYEGSIRIQFPIETLKNIHVVTLKIPPETEIPFYTDNGWFFMPILVPHSNGCSGTDKI